MLISPAAKIAPVQISIGQLISSYRPITLGNYVRSSVTGVDSFFEAALVEAHAGFNAGGIPIGSVLVIDDTIVGRGHNQRVQRGSVVLHAEMDCLENAGRLSAADYARATIYSTLSPCSMCTGAILLYGIPRVVVGESRTFQGPRHLLEEAGVEVTVLDDARCVDLMQRFIEGNPELWNEDIGK